MQILDRPYVLIAVVGGAAGVAAKGEDCCLKLEIPRHGCLRTISAGVGPRRPG